LSIYKLLGRYFQSAGQVCSEFWKERFLKPHPVLFCIFRVLERFAYPFRIIMDLESAISIVLNDARLHVGCWVVHIPIPSTANRVTNHYRLVLVKNVLLFTAESDYFVNRAIELLERVTSTCRDTCCYCSVVVCVENATWWSVYSVVANFGLILHLIESHAFRCTFSLLHLLFVMSATICVHTG
jgi:hypothetical protein